MEMKNMNKETLLYLYEKLEEQTIDELYMLSCLKASGFDKDKAYSLIPTLNDLWLKDENNYSLSKLSDMLYNVYDEDMFELTTRELLQVMYENELNDDEGRIGF